MFTIAASRKKVTLNNMKDAPTVHFESEEEIRQLVGESGGSESHTILT